MPEETTKSMTKPFDGVAIVEIFGLEGDITVSPTIEYENKVVVNVSGPAWLVERVQFSLQGVRLRINMSPASLDNFVTIINERTIGVKKPPFKDFRLTIEIGSEVYPYIEDTLGQVIVQTSCKDVYVRSKRPRIV